MGTPSPSEVIKVWDGKKWVSVADLLSENERLRAALEIAKRIVLAMKGEPPLELVEELEKLAAIKECE